MRKFFFSLVHLAVPLSMVLVSHAFAESKSSSKVQCPRFIADRASGLIETGKSKVCYTELKRAKRDGFIAFSDLTATTPVDVVLRDNGTAGVKTTRPTQLNGNYLIRYAFNDISDTPGKAFKISIINIVTNEKVLEAVNIAAPSSGAAVVDVTGTNLAFQIESTGAYSVLVQEKK